MCRSTRLHDLRDLQQLLSSTCPRGIGILDLLKIRPRPCRHCRIAAEYFEKPVKSLKENGKPMGGKSKDRLDWVKGATLRLSQGT